MAERETYEVFAVKYAHKADRMASQNLIFHDLHDQPMPLDYFVWVIRNENRTYVVDTGFGAREAKERGVPLDRTPAEGLALLGIDAAEVEDVIITHLHYDHAGGQDHFPKATFHLQDAEMSYATGRCMCYEPIRKPFDVEHVTDMVRAVYKERVAFHEGDTELAPGVSIHKIGGHSAGLMCVRVWTKRGWVVLASDCTHFYKNIRERTPFIICYNLGDMMNGYSTMEILADSPDHIIPGHDPLVMQWYPAPSPELEGAVVRLDVPPSET
jgi:glyoxylase-like metal-dependent hydrolase (beta-lactamase superfamily II)